MTPVWNTPTAPAGRWAAVSWHARLRMASLRIGEAEVQAVLRDPLGSFPCAPQYGTGRRVLVGQSIRLITDAASGAVITVELRTAQPYIHGVHDRDNLPGSPSPLAA